ncbi:hypothetical protein SAMN05192529_10920 [Arachidicoccus rhizosphaerae]|uniref:Uncharacterized protein n=2 Tax=Arachidicoccus rhizosphaerae TaxID=551991 RepID=A0A1H3YS69_9BACT|nr:hypothetical protein SAMN05192529_10920 [Arachidicoccus rhizosphaerae]
MHVGVGNRFLPIIGIVLFRCYKSNRLEVGYLGFKSRVFKYIDLAISNAATGRWLIGSFILSQAKVPPFYVQGPPETQILAPLPLAAKKSMTGMKIKLQIVSMLTKFMVKYCQYTD